MLTRRQQKLSAFFVRKDGVTTTVYGGKTGRKTNKHPRCRYSRSMRCAIAFLIYVFTFSPARSAASFSLSYSLNCISSGTRFSFVFAYAISYCVLLDSSFLLSVA